MLPSRGADKISLVSLQSQMATQSSLQPSARSLHILKMLRQNSLGTSLYSKALELSIETCIELDRYEEVEYMLRANKTSSCLILKMHIATLLMHDSHKALETALALGSSELQRFAEHIICGDIQAVNVVPREDKKLFKLLQRVLNRLEERTNQDVRTYLSTGSRVKCLDSVELWFAKGN